MIRWIIEKAVRRIVRDMNDDYYLQEIKRLAIERERLGFLNKKKKKK